MKRQEKLRIEHDKYVIRGHNVAHTADVGTFLGDACISSRLRKLHETGSSDYKVAQGGEIKTMQPENVDSSGT